MTKKLLFFIGIVLLAISVLLFGRFILSGPEDNWICDKGEWVRHGNPSAQKPTGNCGENF